VYCLVSRCKVPPGSQDEMARIYKEEVEPLLSSKPGFQGFGYMIKPDGEALVMGIWDSEDRANARPQKRNYKRVLTRLQSISVGALTHNGYEVPAMQFSGSTQMIIPKSKSSFDEYFRCFTGQWPDEWYRSKQQLRK
jgi:heme-degrading monooxygenase HmoA